jgi:hypothetical protein
MPPVLVQTHMQGAHTADVHRMSGNLEQQTEHKSQIPKSSYQQRAVVADNSRDTNSSHI